MPLPLMILLDTRVINFVGVSQTTASIVGVSLSENRNYLTPSAHGKLTSLLVAGQALATCTDFKDRRASYSAK